MSHGQKPFKEAIKTAAENVFKALAQRYRSFAAVDGKLKAIVKALIIMRNIPSTSREIYECVKDFSLWFFGGVTPWQSVSGFISTYFKQVQQGQVSNPVLARQDDSSYKKRNFTYLLLDPDFAIPSLIEEYFPSRRPLWPEYQLDTSLMSPVDICWQNNAERAYAVVPKLNQIDNDDEKSPQENLKQFCLSMSISDDTSKAFTENVLPNGLSPKREHSDFELCGNNIPRKKQHTQLNEELKNQKISTTPNIIKPYVIPFPGILIESIHETLLYRANIITGSKMICQYRRFDNSFVYKPGLLRLGGVRVRLSEKITWIPLEEAELLAQSLRIEFLLGHFLDPHLYDYFDKELNREMNFVREMSGRAWKRLCIDPKLVMGGT
ncbi:hypothetical protein G9A89_002242 [Geosiphon pyriformis]|nr:hypothetical protein G9A89_002242 [Geosiphon pyriformis]